MIRIITTILILLPVNLYGQQAAVEKRIYTAERINPVPPVIDGARVISYRFGNPDFNFRQFRSNLVIRWEYKPGSTFFVVWSQERTGDEPYGNFSFRKDLRGLFNVYPDNVFLVKFNHWFSL